MKYILQSRLKLYNELLGKYDLIDKYNVLSSKDFELKNMKVEWKINKATKGNLSLLLFKEFSTYQHFKFEMPFKKSFTDLNCFIVTLRKFSLFFYLEFLIIFFFSKNKINYKFQNLSILFSLSNLYYNTFFVLFQKMHDRKEFFQTFISISLFCNISFFLSYYFLPQ